MRTRHAYRHCGLRVASELPLPAMPMAGGVNGDPDVQICIHRTANGGDDAFVLEEALCRFSVPEVGGYEVRCGREISVRPATGAHPQVLSLFVLGTAWGALLYQRGELALHAAVVAIGEGAVAFCGPSMAGKSTSVAWLARRGYPVVSDDLCRVETGPGRAPRVWPAAPRLKLSVAALRAGGWSPQGVAREPPDWKYHLPTAGWSGREPLPLRAVYLLQWGDDSVRKLRGISALKRFHAEAVYRPDLVPAGALERRWQLCVDIVRQVPVWELSRPRGWPELDRAMSDLVRREGWPVD